MKHITTRMMSVTIQTTQWYGIERPSQYVATTDIIADAESSQVLEPPNTSRTQTRATVPAMNMTALHKAVAPLILPRWTVASSCPPDPASALLSFLH